MDQKKLWKTVFKKFEVIWSVQTEHITSTFLKTLPEIFFGPFLNTFSHFDAGCHSLLGKPKVCMSLFKNSQNQHDNGLVRWQLKLLRPFYVEPGLKSHGLTGETLKQEAPSFWSKIPLVDEESERCGILKCWIQIVNYKMVVLLSNI